MTPVGRAIVGAGFAIGVALLIAACFGGPDCGLVQEIRSYPSSRPEHLVLDAAHPVAEQRVTVHLNGAALPIDGAFDARLYVLQPERSGALTSAAPTPTPTPASPKRPVAVTVVRDDTDTVVPTSAPWERSIVGIGRPLVTVPIDCSRGSACDRVYRVRFALTADAEGDVPIEWTVQSQVTYEGISATCGTPAQASTDVVTEAPVLLPATRVATADAPGRAEDGGAITLRHVTVTTDAAPATASLRLSIVRPGFESQRDPAWRQWVRVVGDDATMPSADSLVGAEPYVGIPFQGGTFDLPVLVDCPQGGPCERGYWVVFQNFAAAPRAAVAGPDTPPPSLGKMTWAASAIATYEQTGGAGALRVEIQDEQMTGAAPPNVSASVDDVNVSGGDSATAVDIRFAVPGRQPGTPDPLVTSFAIVHVQGSGTSLRTRLEGDGAGPLTGYANGDGTVNLIAHPFDACPASGVCSGVVTLVAGGRLPWSGSDRGTGVVDVAVDLIGAPPGSTISVGEPYLQPESAVSPAIAVPLALVAVAGLLLIVLAIARRRRRT